MFREIESSITPHQESPPFIRMLRSVAGRIRLELEVNFLVSAARWHLPRIQFKSTRGRVQFLLTDKAEALKLRIQLGSNLPPNSRKRIPHVGAQLSSGLRRKKDVLIYQFYIPPP